MNKTVLELEFKDAQDRKFIVRIDDPKDDLDEETLSLAMENILNFEVFRNNEHLLKEAVAARSIVTTTTEYSI